MKKEIFTSQSRLHVRCVFSLVSLLVLSAGWLFGQPPLRREYIRLGGRVIAIESPQSSVTPAEVRLLAAQTASFSVGGGSAVWSLVPSSGTGTISISGLYTAPATVATETTVKVEARQTAGGTLIGTATVILEPAALLVTPSTFNLQASGVQDFTANMDSNWTVSPQVGDLTVTSNGAHYVAPPSISEQLTVTLTATSKGVPTMSGSASIHLMPASGVCSVAPKLLAWTENGPPQTVTVNCPLGYPWTSSNADAPWVTLTPASGTGTGSPVAVSLSAANLGANSARAGKVMLDGTQIDVRQSPNCGTFANQIVGSPGTSIQLSTGCTAGVSWTSYTGGTSWLRVNPASGTGPTNVTLVVDPYDAAQGAPVRTATVTIQGNSFTVTQHAKCDLNPTTAALGGGIDFRYLQLTCGTMAPWSTSATPSWLAATNADGSSTSGVGSGIIKIASTTGNTTGSVRSATLTVDGKTISVTQSPTSNVTLNPTTASILAGGQVQFVGYIGGAEQTNGLTWTVLSGPGSFSSPTGLFVAPAIVYPGQNTATIQAKDSLGGGATTATITIAPYAPAQGVSVSPATGTALTQSFQFTVVNATDVRTTEMIALFNSNLSTYENGCAIRVVPDGTAPMANLISIQVNTGSSYTQPISADATSGSVENSQCRVLAGPSSVTTNGNTLTVTLQVEFKPGFIGQKEVGVLTNNSTGAITQMAHVGSWNLSANPASLPPNITITAPAASATVGGASVLVQGWALDNMVRAENVITNVQVYVDNTLQGAPVTMNLSSTICTTYPNRPGCPNVGWSFTWDTRFLTNGAHTVKVVATDYDNPAKTSEATVAVTVYNAPGTPLTVTPASTSARMHYTNEAYTPPYPQFTAKRGSAVVTPVIWSTPYTVGGDRYDGFLSTTGVYTPPAPGYHLAGDQIRITATNPSDSNDKGTAWVRLIGMLGGSGYNLVWLYPGQSVSLPSSLGSVIYSLEPNLGTVNFAGTYTHNATSYTPGTLVKVTATSTGDPNKQETAYVKLQ